jgi:hypothetical protein
MVILAVFVEAGWKKLETSAVAGAFYYPHLASHVVFFQHAILDLDSLELILLRHDVILAYRIIFVLLEADSFFFTIRSNSATRGHDYKRVANKN